MIWASGDVGVRCQTFPFTSWSSFNSNAYYYSRGVRAISDHTKHKWIPKKITRLPNTVVHRCMVMSAKELGYAGEISEKFWQPFRFAEICICFIKINAPKFCRAQNNFCRVLISIKRFIHSAQFLFLALNLFAKRLLRSMFAIGETKPKDNMCTASF